MEPSNISIQTVDLDKVNMPPKVEHLRLMRLVQLRREQIERSNIEQQNFLIEQMRLKSQINQEQHPEQGANSDEIQINSI